MRRRRDSPVAMSAPRRLPSPLFVPLESGRIRLKIFMPLENRLGTGAGLGIEAELLPGFGQPRVWGRAIGHEFRVRRRS